MTKLPVELLVSFNDPNDEFNPKDYEEKFFLGVASTKGFSLINTAGYTEVDISHVYGTIEKIVVIPVDEFTPPSKTTIKFTIDPGLLSPYAAPPPYSIEFPVEKLFLWTVHYSFVPAITGMWIKTDSVTAVHVDVYVISTTSPPSVV